MALFRRNARIVFVAALVLAIGFGLDALFTEVQAARCSCGSFYSPVRCSDGKVYQNQCYATCYGATGCVPIGPPPR